MPQWRSNNRRSTLAVHTQNLTARFDKQDGSISFQGTNALVVFEDHSSGIRRLFVAERIGFQDDDRYVYLRPSGRVLEHTEQVGATAPSVVVPRRERSRVGVS